MPGSETAAPMEVDKENAAPVTPPRPVIDLSGVQPDDTNDGDVERFAVAFVNTDFNASLEMGRPIDGEKATRFKTLEVSNQALVFLSLIGMCQPVSGVRPGINGVKPGFCSPFIV